MSITINGTTNTLTAASGLTIAGNTAVTGTLSATGTTTSTVAATANAFIAAASGGGDLLRIVPNAAGNGVDLLARNSADTILEPLALYGETVKLYATGGALIGTISSTGLAVTGIVSASDAVKAVVGANARSLILSQTSGGTDAAPIVSTARSGNEWARWVKSTGEMGWAYAPATYSDANLESTTKMTLASTGLAVTGSATVGTGAASTFGNLILNGAAQANHGSYITFQRNSATVGYIGQRASVIGSGSNAEDMAYFAGTGLGHYWYVNGSVASSMSLDTTGLAVTGTLSSTGSMSVVPTTGTNPAWLFFNNDSGAANSYIGQDGSVAGLDTAYSLNVWNGSNTPIIFGVNNAKVGSWTSTGLTLGSGVNLVMAAGQGIDFSATSNGSGTTTSEVLNDYEEGTWTPALGGTGGASGITYSARSGTYTKIGRQVTVQGSVTLSAKTSITGGVIISDLPFNVAAGIAPGLSVGYWTAMATSWMSLSGYAEPGTGYVVIGGRKTAGTGFEFAADADISATTRIDFSATYFV